MDTYVVLLRGINVGGKNKVAMADLRTCLDELGFADVSTYIASGNVILRSDKRAGEVQAQIEKVLPEQFDLDDELIKVLALSLGRFQAVVDDKPAGFGERPDTYHSDAIFLMGITTEQAMAVFAPREGVDEVWPGEDVIYSQRLSAQRTKSKLNKIMASPLYKSMTIRCWSTTVKLLALLKDVDASKGGLADG
jgi:uncharacterized protein (DUF1697 family)